MIVLADRYAYTAFARDATRGVDRRWGARALQLRRQAGSRCLFPGANRGGDRPAPRPSRQAEVEYASMADEFSFRMLDAKRKVDIIQDELRRQIGTFLPENDSSSGAPQE